MKQKDLEDKNTREAIFDFIENHPGGVDGALSDVERDTKYGQDDQVIPDICYFFYTGKIFGE